MIFFEKSWCGNLVLTEKAVYLHSEMMEIWSDGRGVRHWSAKPFTAVRIRFRPHSFKKHLCKSSIYEGVFLFYIQIYIQIGAYWSKIVDKIGAMD